MGYIYSYLLNSAEKERYRYYRLTYGRALSFLYTKIYRKNIWLNELEVPITTYCTLCCRHCANLLQYYTAPSHVSSEQVIKSLSATIAAVDGIRVIRILGGEPLLHPDLYEILRYCKNNLKEVEKIEIVTNGTLLFQNEVINLMKDCPGFTVLISDYGTNSGKMQLLMQQLESAGIMYIARQGEWRAKANLIRRKRSERSIKKMFQQCCRYVSLLNGELHICPRSSHGTDLKAIPKKEKDYVQIAHYEGDKAALRTAIIKLLKQKYVEACNYCDGDGRTDMSEIVTAGGQCSRMEAKLCFQEMLKQNSADS